LGKAVGAVIALGLRLWETGELRRLRKAGASAEEMVDSPVIWIRIDLV